MRESIDLYQHYFHLEKAHFSRIDHEETMVAMVYQVKLPSRKPLIFKICTRPQDYWRELYFLHYFSGKIPVPLVIQSMEPSQEICGAILMECLPGALLQKIDFTDSLMHEIGSLLARIHSNSASGYGELTQPHTLSQNSDHYFKFKFFEGLDECRDHLSPNLLDQCHHYYQTHQHLFASVDGPCITHHDFRPGNIMVRDGRIQGIFDWASGCASFAEEDFCSLEHGDWPMSAAQKISFLEGYKNIRPVPHYQAMMPLLRLSKAVTLMGFTVKNNTWNHQHAHLYQLNRQFLEDFFSQ